MILICRPLCQALYSALSQLAVGGRLVFYTDSMNPVENEAILYTVITQQRGSSTIHHHSFIFQIFWTLPLCIINISGYFAVLIAFCRRSFADCDMQRLIKPCFVYQLLVIGLQLMLLPVVGSGVRFQYFALQFGFVSVV